ncbi:hypothetical protein UPYG_G00194240 [Umbra pygmaea]|uniref:Uncharacterized protein n=1 Tax=Umbra pygmaea TaxID=75934 RepID=A0ABD0WH31_UMBPY
MDFNLGSALGDDDKVKKQDASGQEQNSLFGLGKKKSPSKEDHDKVKDQKGHGDKEHKNKDKEHKNKDKEHKNKDKEHKEHKNKDKEHKEHKDKKHKKTKEHKGHGDGNSSSSSSSEVYLL